MAKPSASTKPPKGKKLCSACHEAKSVTDFPSNKAEICFSCEEEIKLAPAAPEIPEKPSITVVEASPLDIPSAEIDPKHPTSIELAARTLARRKLLQFIKRFKPKYQASWVHEDICRRLERFMLDVEAGKEPRLLLMMPVRHGKSEIASRHFPPFVLGHHPEWEIIAASGAQSLATSFSRYIRDLLRSDSYKALFPMTELESTSQSVENWATTYGGGYIAAGIGTMITGRGAHILLIDDPVKDAEAADSPIIRDAVWEWYISTALSRLAPGGGVLGILTWWNEDDWAGRVQQLSEMNEGGDKFEIVRYPAVNEDGDEYILADDTIVQVPPGGKTPDGARLTRPHRTALHAERYTLEALMRRKATYFALGQQRWWHALYQQNPTPEDGSYFTKKMFRFATSEPHALERNGYQAWDFAITEKQKNDWIVGVNGWQDTRDDLYVTDVVRFRSDDTFMIADAILDFWVQHGATALIGFEDGQIWKSLKSVFERRCQERSLYPSYEVLPPFTDKYVRAQPLRGRMQIGKVLFNNKASWWDPVRKELIGFGAGSKHDDTVDALSWLVRLTLLRGAPRTKEPKPMKSWKDRLPGLLKGRGASHMSA